MKTARALRCGRRTWSVLGRVARAISFCRGARVFTRLARRSTHVRRMEAHPVAASAALVRAMAFVGMWAVMMLPSLTPMRWRFGPALGTRGGARLGSLTALACAGYFFVWTELVVRKTLFSRR